MREQAPQELAVKSVLDIRTYRNGAGARDEFVRLMAEGTVPMLRRYGIDVVSFGPSIHDDDHSFLIRFFGSLQEREEQLASFYGSDEWLTTYDDQIMALIETYHTVVIPASREVALALATASRREDVGARKDRAGLLHGLMLRVVSSDKAGDVDPATTLAFEQAGPMAWARYEGGKVRLGFLLGALSGSRLECRYVQMANDGRVDGGHSTCVVGVMPDGRVRLTERFQWDTRRGSGTNVFEEIPEPPGNLGGSDVPPVPWSQRV